MSREVKVALISASAIILAAIITGLFYEGVFRPGDGSTPTPTLFPTETPTTAPTPIPSLTTTPPPILLGPVDLNRYCLSLGDVSVSLNGSTANDWRCVTPSGNHVSIDVIKACQSEYNRSDATAIASNVYNPYSWKCYYFSPT